MYKISFVINLPIHYSYTNETITQNIHYKLKHHTFVGFAIDD